MAGTKFTKTSWGVGSGGKHEPSTTIYCDDALGSAVANTFFKYTSTSNEEAIANSHLIAAAPNMYKTILSLMNELNMCIDEVNDMRDIHHNDNFTPADHWDKESLYDAQVLLSKARGE